MPHAAFNDVLPLIGRAAAGLRFDDLPAHVVMRAKQRVFDTIGCLVAGYDAGIASEIRDYVLAQGGAAEATLLPGGQKTTVSHVCMAHATYMHGLELTDAAPRGTCHPGNEVVPPALAYAEKLNRSGAEVLAAVVAGYEIEIRFGRAVFPSAFYRGWWTPGLWGGIGSAVAAASLMKLDAVAMDNTLGIAVNLLPTAMMQANEEGETIKWLLGGQSCAAGLVAAEMAARGVKGMRNVIGGFLPVLADKTLPERLTEGISEGITNDAKFTFWEVAEGIVTKHYATVGPLFASLDAMFDLIKEHNITDKDIAEIHVDAMKRTAVFNTVHPENDVAARGSLPYCLALAVCKRDPALLLGPGFATNLLRDPQIRAMASKVKITENDDYERQYPARSLARVTLKLNNGKTVSAEVDRSQRGRYLTPTDADIEHKFRLLATGVIGQAKTDSVVALCKRFETLPNMQELIESIKVV
jgi:2-methylcitrate dehydratase PrpD